MSRLKVYPYELIGKEIEVVEATNESNLRINGKIVDETKFTLKVEQEGKIKTLLKKNITLRLKKTGQVIPGKTLARKPEERIK